MKTSENISNVLKGLLQVQSKMNNVVKDSKNPFFKSNYADINALRDELNPLLTEAGLTLMQPPTTYEGKNYIETMVAHAETGEFMSSLNEIIVAKQNDPQSYLAAQTYTRRGALQAFFNMGAVDDDGNYASGKAEKLQNQKRETGVYGSSKPNVSPAVNEKIEKAAIPATAVVGSEAPPKKTGGFGVKKPVEPAPENGWD